MTRRARKSNLTRKGLFCILLTLDRPHSFGPFTSRTGQIRPLSAKTFTVYFRYKMVNSTQIVVSASEIAALRPQWDALWHRVGGSYIQASTSCLAAWKCMLEPQGACLMIAARFEDDELVALWPITVRRRGLWRVLNQAGPMAAEFSNVLVELGPLAEARVAELWQAIGRSSLADLAIIPFVKPHTPLGAVLATDHRIVAAEPDIAPYVAWLERETWDGYYKSLSPAYRKVHNKKRRQLLEFGETQFEVVTDRTRLPSLISWLLQEKRVWADRANKRGTWVFSPIYEAFLISLAVEETLLAKFVVFLLSRDGEPMAAQFAMVGPRHIDWIIASFAAPFARFSPGTILNEHCLKYALACGLDVEFGAGREENKRFWSRNAVHKTLNYRIALNRWGALGEHLARLVVLLRARLKRSQPQIADEASPIPVPVTS